MMKFNTAIQTAANTLNIDYSENMPEKKYIYYAYKNGIGARFDTLESAREYSYLTDQVQINGREISEYWSNKTKVIELAEVIWKKSLREYYSEFSDILFDVCYNAAHRKGFTGGYDVVAEYMRDYTTLALDIEEAGAL
jgi:hypothetical protein